MDRETGSSAPLRPAVGRPFEGRPGLGLDHQGSVPQSILSILQEVHQPAKPPTTNNGALRARCPDRNERHQRLARMASSLAAARLAMATLRPAPDWPK